VPQDDSTQVTFLKEIKTRGPAPISAARRVGGRSAPPLRGTMADAGMVLVEAADPG